MMEVRK